MDHPYGCLYINLVVAQAAHKTWERAEAFVTNSIGIKTVCGIRDVPTATALVVDSHGKSPFPHELYGVIHSFS